MPKLRYEWQRRQQADREWLDCDDEHERANNESDWHRCCQLCCAVSWRAVACRGICCGVPYIYFPVRLPARPPARPSVRPSVCPSVRPSVRPSVSQSVFDKLFDDD